MKRMSFLKAMPFLVLFLYAASAYAQESSEYLVTDWGYEPNTFINKVYIDDLNADGVYELIATSRDGVVYDLGKTAKGHVNWQTSLGADVRALKVVDFDGDGKKEVIAGADKPQLSLRLLDWQGINKGSTIDFNQRVYAIDAADIDGDGKNDIVVGASSGKVSVIGSGEKLLWEYKSKGAVYFVHASDIDGDGKTEVVALSLWSENEDEYAQVYALDNAGKKVKWAYDVLGGISTSAANPVGVYDIDGDGKKEVVVGTSSHGMDALGPDGRRLWNFPTEKRVNVVYSSDLQGKGKQTILVGATPYIYAIDSEGKLVWKLPVTTTILSMYSADINSDSRAEVLAGASKYIHIISDSGKLISSWSYKTPGSEAKGVDVRSIYAGDLDGDGGKEVAAGFGWIDNPLDQSYSKGDIRVFKVNKEYVSSPPAQEEKEDTSVTTSTEPPVKKATTTSTTITQPEKEREPAEETATTTAGTQEKPKAEMPWMILIIAGMGLFLLIVSILVFFLVFKKKPPEKKEPDISKT